MKRSTYFILLLFFRGSWPRLSWWRAACTPRRELRSCRSFPNRLILCRPGDLQGHVVQRSRPLCRHRSGGSICLSRGWEQRGKGCLVVLFHVVCFWVRNLVIVFHVFIFRHNPRVVILNEKNSISSCIFVVSYCKYTTSRYFVKLFFQVFFKK